MSNFKVSLIAMVTFILGVTIGWLVNVIDNGLTATYRQVSIDDMKSDRDMLRKFVMNRNVHSTDYETLQNMQINRDEILDKKYETWHFTPIGLVQFGDVGNIESLCFSDLNTDLVCDDFPKDDKNK